MKDYRRTVNADLVERYLRLLGARPGSPTPETLAALHRAHVRRLAHDTLWMARGRIPPADHEALVGALLAGEGGACVQLNFGFAWLLDQLGFDVEVHAARLQGAFDPEPGPDPFAHAVLTVAFGAGERWFADVGLGSALLEPVPLVTSTFEQAGGFRYALGPATSPDADWHFEHDRRVRAARALEFALTPVSLAEYERPYRFYATDPASPLLANITAHRRLSDCVLSLNGTTFVRRGRGRSVRMLASAAEWERVLREEFLLSLPGWSDAERDRLWWRAGGIDAASGAQSRPRW